MDLWRFVNLKSMNFMVTITLIFYLVPFNNIVEAAGDGEPPVIESLEVSPQEVTVGEQVKVKAKVTDNTSDVSTVRVTFYSPTKSRTQSINLNYNEQENSWEGTYTIKDTDEDGIWTFWFTHVEDSLGNEKNYDYNELSFSNLDFHVTNENGDGDPPLVESIEVNPKEVTVGEQVNIKAKVTDNSSGVSTVRVTFYSPTKSRTQSINLNYNEQENSWEGTYTIKDTDEDGTWTFWFTHVEDSAGNEKNYDQNDLTFIISGFNVVTPIDLGIEPISKNFTTTNEYWTRKTINGDLYVGPNSIITINGDVTIDGDVYIFGAIKNFGNLNITGTVYAKRSIWGSQSSISNGTLLMLGGTNNISSMVMSNQGWDIPFKIYNDNYIVKDGHIEFKGAIIPVAELYLEGKPVKLSYNGTFIVSLDNVTTDKVTFSIVDVFGNKLNKEVSVVQFVSSFYKSALWYFANGSNYNAVYYAGEAFNEGDTRQELKALMDQAAYALLNEAAGMTAEKAEKAYNLLSKTKGVPLEIKTAADEKLTVKVSANYKSALWYYKTGSNYNAVYFAGEAYKEGDTSQELKDLMNQAANALLNEAAGMTAEKAEKAYNLLSKTTGVPSEIKAAADEKLTPEVASANYKSALWYYKTGSNYNAVYYAGEAFDEGDTRQELKDLMGNAAEALLAEAESMTAEKAEKAYSLLSKTTGVPTGIKAAADEKLSPEVVSANYKSALWYYKTGSNYNAVYYAGEAFNEGDTRQELKDLMGNAAEALLNEAASMTAEKAEKAYNLLSKTTEVPTEIKAAADEKLTPEVVSAHYKNALWYYSTGSNYNAVYYAGEAFKEGDIRQELKDLMRKAAEELLTEASGMSETKSQQSYSLLSKTPGVPEEIKVAADAVIAK